MSTDNINLDLFSAPIRKISGAVDVSFYVNSDDNEASVDVNWSNGFKTLYPWLYARKDQLSSFGFKPLRKYGILDGKSFLASGSNLENAVYPMDTSADTVTPLYSEKLCSGSKAAGTLNGYSFAEADYPRYTLDYNGLHRQVNQMMIVGDEKRLEFPVKYRVELFMETDSEVEDNTFQDIFSADFVVINANPYSDTTVQDTIANITKVYRKVVYQVDHSNVQEIIASKFVKQMVVFPKQYFKALKVVLEIEKWSDGGTVSKIMYLSNDMRINMNENEVQSISVLEEKSSSLDELSYGITSNSCSVSVLNTNDRFTNNIDLLKKNRLIYPYVIAKDLGNGINEQTEPLGKFFSEQWEVSSSSDFIKCKAYDVLYNLQNMKLYYTLDREDNGHYVMDGGWRGTGCLACPKMDEGCNACTGKRDNACYVFKKIFKLINLQKKDSGIYGSNLKCHIDPRLKNIKFEHALIGYDTAWNILQDMANRCLANVYVDRKGDVCVACDNLAGETNIPAEFFPACSAKITPDNSFTYELPTLSKTLVNRVVVPYVTLGGNASDSDNRLKIEQKDWVINENINIKINVDLKNTYENITAIVCENHNGQVVSLSDVEIRLSHGYCTLIFSNIQVLKIGTQFTNYITVEFFSSTPYKKLESNNSYIEDDKLSQKQNGIKSFELRPNCLVEGMTQADSIAKKILSNYKNGKSYIQTDWQGTPQMKTGAIFQSYSKKNTNVQTYECLSNEFTIDGGLKTKTKARQK